MRVFDLDIILLLLLGISIVLLRRLRLNGRVTNERALLLQSLVLGILVGIIFALLSTGNIWTHVRLK